MNMRLRILAVLMGLTAAVCGCDSPGPSPADDMGPPKLRDESTMYETPGTAGEELVSLSASSSKPLEKEAELSNPFQFKKVTASRVQVTLDGQKMVPSERGAWWEISEPVSADPSMSFSTEMAGALRVNLALWPCGDDGRITDAKGYTLADPTGRALTSGRPFCLSSPEGCLIVGESSVERIPFKSGQRYLARLRVAAGSDEETVTLTFKVR